MKRIYYIGLTLFLIGLLPLQGCKKFLDVKSDSQLVTPSTLQDLQALLDNSTKVNRSNILSAEASADNYYLSTTDYLGLNINLRRVYTWEKDNLFPVGANDWANAYDNVFIANTVLDNIVNVDRTDANKVAWNNAKGQALFVRAHAFLQLAFTFALAYDVQTANSDLGIPLRLTSDINEVIRRSTVQQTYDQVITDLNEAISLLDIFPVHVMRASKPAALALLARTYLSMRDYDNCLVNADASLKLKSNLLNYNMPDIPNLNATFPFNTTGLIYNNPEIIYAGRMISQTILSNTRAKIDAQLYNTYDVNDHRRLVFYKENTAPNVATYSYRGSYDGGAILFDGLATDEVYLMRAECYARKGMVTEAMTDLNTLMVKRWNKNVNYPTFTAANASDALNKVLIERRKELVMRGLRWMDLKRFNKDGANITLSRTVDGTTYTLPPNDLRYALAIPEDVIAISGMPQNRR